MTKSDERRRLWLASTILPLSALAVYASLPVKPERISSSYPNACSGWWIPGDGFADCGDPREYESLGCDEGMVQYCCYDTHKGGLVWTPDCFYDFPEAFCDCDEM